MPNPDILTGARAIGEFLNLEEGTVRRNVRNRLLPTYRVGTTICARKSTLLAWISAQERENATGGIAPRSSKSPGSG